MNKYTLSAVCLSLVLSGNILAKDNANILKSREAVKTLGMTLKKNLVGAMKEGGPIKAIKFCNLNADPITKKVQGDTGMQITRTSLKLRNPANKADEWEAKVLKDFATRSQKGEDIKTMDYSETLDVDGKSVFRYMKAIPTGEACLVCHGKSLGTEIKTEIDKLYPADNAKGFKTGELRGAFTVKLDL